VKTLPLDQRAGVRHPTVYRHFPDEEALPRPARLAGARRTLRRTLLRASVEDPARRVPE
jgi:AcrR family transcriptional regulator